MTLASIQAAISYRSLLLIPVAVTAGMVLLVRAMRKLGLRPQFMVLLILGVSIGVYFSSYGANARVLAVAGCYSAISGAHRQLLWRADFSSSVALEEKDEDDKIRAEDAHEALDRKFPNMKPTNHTL